MRKSVRFIAAVCAIVCFMLSPLRMKAAEVLELEAGAALPEPTGGKAVVVDFNASWCMPCRMFRPAFDKAAGEYAGKAVFVSVNIDECPEVARAFGVKSIPYVVVLGKDREPITHLGAMNYADLTVFLDAALK